ncbi:MAG TPA: HNH endonuclease signature motif containing protein [Candidatus Saccharimonadales bacterium]|nr:HNH endonuclease signature motif containing protein [Candidatus Saccharimonadales bacterium]
MGICLTCGQKTKRNTYKYCSVKCQCDNQYNEYIQKWKKGLVSGNRGTAAKNISGHLVRYLRKKYGEKCSLCEWNKIHSITGKVPLEIDHINGNSDDNSEENLRLICPNCHALSENFRNLNKGKGRAWRMTKYKNSSIN